MNYGLIFLLQVIITVLFCFLATIFDVKKGIVPNWLTCGLIVFGLISNLLLAWFSSNIKFILASIISLLVTYAITYLMWQLNIWGGGDVKLFTGIASVIPFDFNIDFLNIFPQLSVYPFSFSVIINSVLVSFPFLLIFLFYLLLKNNIFKRSSDFLFNVFNFTSVKILIESTLNRLVDVKDIRQGTIVNKYYFSNEYISDLIREVDGNLKIYKSDDKEYRFYFKSQSAGGITEREMYLLKILATQGFISDKLSVKIAFPFTPSILLGLIIALVYGDMIVLFTKNLFLVI